MKNKALLLTPGPVAIPQKVLNSLSLSSIHHRSAEFVKIFKQTQILLKKIFQTEQEILILNGSGTAGMSAGLLNTLSPGDPVLALSAGKFGDRWIEMAQAYNLKVHTVKAPWGQAISPQKVKVALNKNPNIKAVLAQACETSTGVLHPVKEIAQVIKNKSNTLFILDAISALGVVDLPMDKWGIDVMVGGSQKSFCLPAGMSFVALSKKAWQFHNSSRLPVYYLDLKKEKIAQAKGQTAFSTNVYFVRALYAFGKNDFLKNSNGLKKRIQKTKQLSQITQQFCKDQGWQIFSHPPSPSVTAIALPKHIDGVKLKKHLEEKYKVTVGGGQGKLTGRILRIGHLGDTSPTELKQALKCLQQALSSF